MKKIALTLSVVAMSMGFVACDNYELPNPPAQNNPATAPFNTENIAVVPLEGEAATALDLKALNDADEQAVVGTLMLTDWPSEYELVLTMYMSRTADMANAQAVPAAVNEEGFVTVSPDLLQGAYSHLTKSPEQSTVYVNYGAIAALRAGSKLYIGGPDYRFGETTLSVIPFPLDYVIEQSYYLLHNGEKTALSHSAANQYDDPVFTTVVEITADEAAAGYQWQIVPASGAPALGGEGTSGTLAEGVTGSLSLSGPVMFTFNLEDLSFEIINAYTVLYTPGGSNGWSQADSQTLFTSDYRNYSGWINVTDEFKFCATLDWAVNWGVGDQENTLAPGGDNIKVTANGVYYAKVDLVDLTYAITFMESCGVIGDATEGGWDAQTNLTQSQENPLVWEGKIKFNAGGEWKIRFNDNWDFNLGGDMANLTQGGDNIATPGEGEHTVRVDLSQSPYVVTVK